MDIEVKFSFGLKVYNEVWLSFRLTINYRDVINFSVVNAPNFFNYGSHYVWIKNAYYPLDNFDSLVFGDYLPENNDKEGLPHWATCPDADMWRNKG